MARITGSIPNFINGISQQPAAIRLPSQAEEQINCYSTVAKGLVKRPPTEHVCKISDSQADDTFVHLINRDTTERYVVVCDYTDTNKVRVFDFDGVEKTVNIPDGTGYIPSSPSENMTAISVADFTFMVNKTKVVAKGASQTPTREFEALISFGTIQPGSTVKVFINGTERASLAISDTDPSDLETNYVAAQIRTQLEAAVGPSGSGYFDLVTLTQAGGSVIYLRRDAGGSDFTVEVRDGSNGLGIKVIKGKVQYFEDLPREGRENFVVEVAGDPVTGFGSYWVKFEDDTVPVWVETAQPGIDRNLDASTMPHTLVRNAGGDFTFEQADWNMLAVGDEESNPFPSFVGETINDIFFHQARLAVLAGESVVMSEAGEFFNFFRTTVTSLVDGDVIDVGTNHTKVSVLRHAVPYQEQLLLFSDQTQFRLTQGDLLAPSTVGIQPITEFESSINAKPAPVGNFVFFAVEKADYASMREYFVADDSQRNDAREITGHIPEYIQSGIRQIAGSSNEDILIIKSDNAEANELYVYKYFWSGNEKVQSSWSKLQFPDVEIIYGYGFIKSTLYIVVKRADGVFLEKVELDTGARDESGTGHILHADRKCYSSDDQVTATYYGGLLGYTAYSFDDIVWSTSPVCVGIAGNTEFPPGYEVARIDVSQNLLTRSEDLSNAAWTKAGTGPASISATDSANGPDGVASMDTVTFTANTDDVVSYSYSGVTTGGTYTASVYLKEGTASLVKFRLRFEAGGTPVESLVTVDLSAGSVSAVTGPGTAAIEALAGGLYRVSITMANNSTGNTDAVVALDQAAAGTIFAGYAQLELGDLSKYIKTTTESIEQALIYDGNLTSENFMFGLKYLSTYTLSEIVAKTSSQSGSEVPITEGRLQLFWMAFRYAFTGYFKVTVSTVGRADNVYVFNGRTLGSSENPINELPVDSSGKFRVPIYSRSDRATITVSSDDVLPFRLISADWIANLIQKFRRV